MRDGQIPAGPRVLEQAPTGGEMASEPANDAVRLGPQVVVVAVSILAYFAVRGLTEGAIATGERNARSLLRLESALGLDLERGLQAFVLDRPFLTDLANWVYIWAHWPVVVATLVWLARRHRDDYFELRNAMIISGAIGLVIFATFPVAPPRLWDPSYVDTVTIRSNSYRLLQPPALVNKYAAMPSLHFGWNLLVGLVWARHGRRPLTTLLAVLMSAAMAFAVVATANHWLLDAVVGGLVALGGLVIERARRRWIARRFARGQPPVGLLGIGGGPSRRAS
jgi:hypothetical protein